MCRSKSEGKKEGEGKGMCDGAGEERSGERDALEAPLMCLQVFPLFSPSLSCLPVLLFSLLVCFACLSLCF